MCEADEVVRRPQTAADVDGASLADLAVEQQRSAEIAAIERELLDAVDGPVPGMAAENFYYRAVRIWERRHLVGEQKSQPCP